jgi:DNA-binding transcriptional regulator GbsR (MarR family)
MLKAGILELYSRQLYKHQRQQYQQKQIYVSTTFRPSHSERKEKRVKKTLMQAQEIKKGINTEILPIDAYSVPTSAKTIFEILNRDGPLTSGDIEKKCSYSDRTVRNSLKKLINIGLVSKVANFTDMRTSLFNVRGNTN